MVRHSSHIDLSQSALRHNFSFIRGRVGAHTEISFVVKANAYGHGIEHMVPMAERCDIRHFAVASSFEAQEVLSACSEGSRVMIMGILYDDDLPWVIENGVELYVFDLDRLERAREVAAEVGRPAIVHLEVETGGHRTGLPGEDLKRALSILKKHKEHLRFEGFCTHYAGIETLANQFRINKQDHRFEELWKVVVKSKHLPAKRHAACSGAALGFPDKAMDLVRVGTAAYGLWPSPDIYNLHLMTVNKPKDSPLHRVLSWKTNVMHLKRVAKDEFVGYGTSFQAPRDLTVAVLPVGYSNGYPRALSNRGHVLIRGKKAYVVGVINMNMFMVDVTNIPDVAVGDEAVLIGRQGKRVIGLSSFSEFATALNNEFASRLPAAIPRRIVR